MASGAVTLWKSINPRRTTCPLCGQEGRLFIKHKRGTTVLGVSLVCFNHSPLYTFFSNEADDPLVPEIIALSKSFPTETTNLVILEVDTGVRVTA